MEVEGIKGGRGKGRWNNDKGKNEKGREDEKKTKRKKGKSRTITRMNTTEERGIECGKMTVGRKGEKKRYK